MIIEVTAKTGFFLDLDLDRLIIASRNHNEFVIDVIPAKSLLIFEVKRSW
jgi:hypothetical protein